MNTKKNVISIISIVVLMNNISGVFATNKTDKFEFENTESLEMFEMLRNNNSYTASKSRSAKVQSNEFNEVIENANTNDAIENISLFSSNESQSESQISYNYETKHYILSEYNDSTNTLLMAIDDSKYIFEQIGENVVMIDEKGQQQVVSEMIYEGKSLANDYINIKEIEKRSIQSRMAGYTKSYGPFYKTNKSWIKVLELVSKVTKTFKFVHPVLGTISLITNAVAKVGDGMTKTLYIRYYQSFLLSKLTFTREEQNWYTDDTYKVFVKGRVLSFDSVRPGY